MIPSRQPPNPVTRHLHQIQFHTEVWFQIHGAGKLKRECDQNNHWKTQIAYSTGRQCTVYFLEIHCFQFNTWRTKTLIAAGVFTIEVHLFFNLDTMTTKSLDFFLFFRRLRRCFESWCFAEVMVSFNIYFELFCRFNLFQLLSNDLEK